MNVSASLTRSGSASSPEKSTRFWLSPVICENTIASPAISQAGDRQRDEPARRQHRLRPPAQPQDQLRDDRDHDGERDRPRKSVMSGRVNVVTGNTPSA